MVDNPVVADPVVGNPVVERPADADQGNVLAVAPQEAWFPVDGFLVDGFPVDVLLVVGFLVDGSQAAAGPVGRFPAIDPDDRPCRVVVQVECPAVSPVQASASVPLDDFAENHPPHLRCPDEFPDESQDDRG